jgi:DNA polymerase-3 subunit epsilon
MYLPDFLNGFDRLVAFDAETTGKRTPEVDFIRRQPFAWRAPGIIIENGFVEMLRDGEGWRKGGNGARGSTPMGLAIPRPSKSTGFGPPISRTLHDSRRSCRFVGDSPIVAHAYKNERDFLDYEFARAKVIQWGEAPTLRSATFARRSYSPSFSLERSSR